MKELTLMKARIWSQPKFPSADAWIEKMYLYTVDTTQSLKRKKQIKQKQSFACTKMDPAGNHCVW